MGPSVTDFVDPQTGVRNVEAIVNVTRNHVEEYFGKHNYQCQCVAWTSRGEIISRPANVVVACEYYHNIIIYCSDITMYYNYIGQVRRSCRLGQVVRSGAHGPPPTYYI